CLCVNASPTVFSPLSLHDALPISPAGWSLAGTSTSSRGPRSRCRSKPRAWLPESAAGRTAYEARPGGNRSAPGGGRAARGASLLHRRPAPTTPPLVAGRPATPRPKAKAVLRRGGVEDGCRRPPQRLRDRAVRGGGDAQEPHATAGFRGFGPADGPNLQPAGACASSGQTDSGPHGRAYWFMHSRILQVARLSD